LRIIRRLEVWLGKKNLIQVCASPLEQIPVALLTAALIYCEGKHFFVNAQSIYSKPGWTTSVFVFETHKPNSWKVLRSTYAKRFWIASVPTTHVLSLPDRKNVCACCSFRTQRSWSWQWIVNLILNKCRIVTVANHAASLARLRIYAWLARRHFI